MSSFLKYFLHIFFPVCCPVCGAVGEVACDACLASLCVPNSDWFYSFTEHEGKARDIVLSLKYGGNEALGRAMGRCIGRALPDELRNRISDTILVPLPLHKNSTRRFNQARAIARGLSQVCGVKIFDALTWTKEVEGQTGKNKKEREALAKDVFRADKIIAGKKIIIVDDVCTTGTTLRRASEACRGMGAEVAGIIVWARAKDNI